MVLRFATLGRWLAFVGVLLAGAGHDGSAAEAARELLSRGARAVLVTLGAAGCQLYQAGQPPVTLAGRTMPVRDTIGAGDTFTGALAAALPPRHEISVERQRRFGRFA